MSRPPYTVPEAMQVLGVADKTIRRMLAAGQLKEAGRDAGNRILIDPDTVEAVAVHMGRMVTARQEVREIAPAINANAEASLAAINAFRDVVQQQNQRIFELQQQLADLRAAQKYLPGPGRVQELEAEVQRLKGENERLQALEHEHKEQSAQAPVHPGSQGQDQSTGGIFGGLFRRRRSGG